MNPLYKFELNVNGTQQQAFPDYRESLSKDYALESQEQFYRAKLNGELTFKGNDFARIVNAAFDTEFVLVVSITYDYGATWEEYWQGSFWKTDCKFDEDGGTATVTPGVKDRYTDILAGLDKEYNLIDLMPEITPVKADKRGMVQIYFSGENVISCFLSGMWWEQECEAVSSESDLINTYHFLRYHQYREINVTGVLNPDVTGVFVGDKPGTESTNYQSFDKDGYSFKFTYTTGSGYVTLTWEIINTSTNASLWRYSVNNPSSVPTTITLQPVSGSGASGTATAEIRDVALYGRVLLDKSADAPPLQPIYPLPVDDMGGENRNYHYVAGFVSFGVYPSSEYSSTPTKWGIYQPGKYYIPPSNESSYIENMFPVGRSSWGAISYWLGGGYWTWEQYWRKQFTIRDAYPLASVISVLLGTIAPGISHAGTADYSQFLYGINPLDGMTLTPIITPKSNVIFSNYDQPAQRAMVTLRQVLDMLRDCFRCYWWIDEQSRFRIEHISYFMRGGSYSIEPEVGIDLTSETVSRNGKPWDFGRNQYEFDKLEMPERYQFGWMDEATQLFNGYPIEIVSKFVEQGNIQNIQISHFSSDIDYILLQPGGISREGFVLMQAQYNNGEYELPYYQIGSNQELQNGYVAFVYLQSYYAYDMPARSYKINGVAMTAAGVKKLKKQTLRFPVVVEPNLYQFIKTKLGNGIIEKMSVNLCSRTANTTLKYDTEQ